jgi:uncharacterized protein with HEPN domain
MELKIKTWLSDIHTAIDEIESFLPEKNDFFSFKNDLKTRKAVERNIEIIGEAVNRIGKQDQSIQINNAKRITRNTQSFGSRIRQYLNRNYLDYCCK